MRLTGSLSELTVFSLGALVGVGLGWLVVGGFGSGEGEPTPPTPVEHASYEPAESDPAPAAPSAASPEPGPGPGDDASIPDTTLPLRLLGTVVADATGNSQAVILDVEARFHMVVREGDALESHDDVSVRAIERRRVVLDTERGLEQLWLSSGYGLSDAAADAGSEGTYPSPEPRDRPLRSTAQLQRERDPNVPPEVVDAMNRLAIHLAGDLEVVYDEDGRIEGARAASIAEGGLLEQAGVERDELIRGVNGVVIDDPEAASRVLRDLANCEPVSAMVSGRNGNREVEVGAELLKQFGCVGTF